MTDWVPLHQHSMYSLLDGLSKPHQMAGRAAQCGYRAAAITDHGTVAGAASFQKAMKDCCTCGHEKRSHADGGKAECKKRGCTCEAFAKAGIKPILGSEFYLCKDRPSVQDPANRPTSHLCVLARSKQGWKNLVRASSESNRPEHFYYRPRLDLESLAKLGGGELVAFSGHIGSDMADVIFGENCRRAYSAEKKEDALSFRRSDWKRAAVELACRYRDLFGKGRFWLEKQVIDRVAMPVCDVVAEVIDYVSKKTGIPRVATADSHYPTPDDAFDQRILLCSAFQTNLQAVENRLAAGEDVTLGGFFRSKRYHIPTYEEMAALHEPAELAASLEIAEMCEAYDVLGQPMLPAFPCPDGMAPGDYLRRLCDAGWRAKLGPKTFSGLVVCPGTGVSNPVSVYQERLERELKVILEAGLEGYFLIVQDFCGYARTKGKVGKGRGSGAGCLVSYLTGITDVDPIEYGLIFERFYNAGRNTPERVALPDIDCDFEKFKREGVIAYIKAKYGTARVAQMATFTRMQGRGALRDVLKAHGACDFEEMGRITEHVPDEASISDHLQEMLEERGEASIIQWALENEADGLKQWCSLREDGTLEGPMAKHFAQAIRMEGTLCSAGKHPSGLIISAVDLADVVPMVYDKSSRQMMVGVDMRDAELMGLVKFDILGTAVLDKVRGAAEIMRTGRLPA